MLHCAKTLTCKPQYKQEIELMKILFITPYYPPYESIAAVRTELIVKSMTEQNIEVYVLSAEHEELYVSEKPLLENPKVTHLPWLDSNPKHKSRDNSVFFRFFSTIYRAPLIKFYRTFFYWPDRHQFWKKRAITEGSKIIKDWKPDLIYSSSSPFSAHLIGSYLSQSFALPWVAEYRDPWVENHFNAEYRFKEVIKKYWEKHTLRNCRFIVSVNDEMKEEFERRLKIPAYTILTGFQNRKRPASFKKRSRQIRIVYTGSLYLLKRSPEVIFSALRNLGEDRQFIRLEFYGPDSDLVLPLAKKYDVQDLVFSFGNVSRQTAHKKQSEADVLLMLMWKNELEGEIYTGKFFEYLGAQKPILVSGRKGCLISEEIKSNSIGPVVTDVQSATEVLRGFLTNMFAAKPIWSISGRDVSEFEAAALHEPLIARLKEIALAED